MTRHHTRGGKSRLGTVDIFGRCILLTQWYHGAFLIKDCTCQHNHARHAAPPVRLIDNVMTEGTDCRPYGVCRSRLDSRVGGAPCVSRGCIAQLIAQSTALSFMSCLWSRKPYVGLGLGLWLWLPRLVAPMFSKILSLGLSRALCLITPTSLSPAPAPSYSAPHRTRPPRAPPAPCARRPPGEGWVRVRVGVRVSLSVTLTRPKPSHVANPKP